MWLYWIIHFSLDTLNQPKSLPSNWKGISMWGTNLELSLPVGHRARLLMLVMGLAGK